MADASGVTSPTGLGNDPQVQAMRASLNKLIADVGRLRMFTQNRLTTAHGLTFTDNSPSITSATTAGLAKLTNTITYLVGGTEVVKAATDNLWDLTGLSYDATLYTGVLLLLSSAGTATITSATSTSSALAIQSVLVKHTDTTKAAVGAFVANNGSTFGNSALAVQGSFSQGLPALCDLQAYSVAW